ncbi:MAG: hypothetical protein R2757_19240 [Draconibacterium sp.]
MISSNLCLAEIVLWGIIIISIGVCGFLIVSGYRNKKDAPYALGLPQGSVRAILAVTLILLFILLSIFFLLEGHIKDPQKYVDSILTIVGTLVIAVSSFYFGSKATEQGSKIVKDVFKQVKRRRGYQ